MPFGPFISQEEKDNINRSLHQNYGYKPRPVRGQKPEPQRTRSSAKREIDEARESASAETPTQSPAPRERTGRGSFRDSYSSGNLKDQFPAQNSNNQGGGYIRGRSGAKRGASLSSPAPAVEETQNPTRPSQPTGGGTVNAFGQNFDMSVPAEAKAYSALQQQELTRQRTHSPFSDLRGGDGVGSDGSRLSGRGEQRVNSNGVMQTGTQTGPKEFTDHSLEGLFGGISKRYDGETADLVRDTRIFNHFSSNQLPTTQSNPYQNVGPVADGGEYARNIKGAEQYKGLTGVGPVPDGEAYAGAIEQSANTGRQAQLNAITNPNLDSMDALRVREAAQGLVYASGQYWTPGQDGKLTQIDRDVAKQIKRGGDAQALLQDAIGAIKGSDDVPQGYQPSQLDANGFVKPDSNMITLKDGTQKLMSDMTEDDWNK